MRAIILLTPALVIAAHCPSQESVLGRDRSQIAFFDPNVVQDIHLEVAVDDLTRMRAALPERIYVPATFRWRGLVLKRVGLRYKGNSSSRVNQSHKRSFLVKFSEFVKKQRFLGLRRVALDNGVQFGSLFSERLITDILRDVGVRASRSNYARVRLNGKFIGVYVNVERIDREFLKRAFPNKKGVLYKVHDGGPGADLRFVGEDPAQYARTFELKEGKKRAKPGDLVQLIQGVDGRSGEAFDFRKAFDVDSFVWQMGVLLLAGAFDQYTGWGPHNYYLFHVPEVADSDVGRWHYLTWDLDVAFADKAFGNLPVIDGWHAAWPVMRSGRPLLEQIVNDKELLALYRKRAKKLLETHFEPKRLGERLDKLYAQIKADLKRDPFPKRRVTNRSDRSYEDIIDSMKKFMARRYRTAVAQLEAPGARPKPSTIRPRGRQGRRMRPGPPSKDAPSELTVARVSKDGVELTWKDNATGERAIMVQRCVGAENERFQNLKGFPGRDLTRATDDRVRPGVTYRYRIFALKPTPRGVVCTGVSNVVTVRVKER